ncbi:unnamed protein product [Medioppia subpectinata]|uniref:Vacuolar protein sorting-associated protein VTA1 n=1 Tax=Medioppia subpectinata TaxID=1979941 RepID=A0A7R9KQ50_9ACAR|nr:unnamed protein product [Medioppia subpectinata]CAG2107758.1 unnamed protein product [Medioppia subpectinata]
MAQNIAPFPAVPPSLRSLQTFMRIASDLEKMDPTIGYWCRFYCVQTGLKIDSKSKEAEKKLRHENEAVTNEMVGQAHVENYALNMFNKADTDDREGSANKNTSRLFLISSHLFDVLSVFGEVPEEVTKRCKYAKWKAIYISRCLKNGETPVPGPVAGTDAEDFDQYLPNIPSADYGMTSDSNEDNNTPQPLPRAGAPNFAGNQPAVSSSYSSQPMATETESVITAMNGMSLSAEDVLKAQKYCKFAGSALQYEDIPTAITNLQKALSLLTTGQE